MSAQQILSLTFKSFAEDDVIVSSREGRGLEGMQHVKPGKLAK
jgi:hypothetical protein